MLVEKGFHCTVTKNFVDETIESPETAAVGADMISITDISS